SQSIQGHLEIMHKRQAIDRLLEQKKLPAATLEQLAGVKPIRDFAVRELGLPADNSYRDYVDTGREYVVWNVFAAPALSLEARQWCFLFIGCVAYRGYFAQDDARKFAAELASQGYDVFTGGVSAYSTLGWFDDPILNTMLRRDRLYLARVIFHELAHRKLYLKGDTDFNEAFADTVADAGVRMWLSANGTLQEREGYDAARLHDDIFVSLVMRYRGHLEAIYNSGQTDAEKLRQKQTVLEKMKNDYGKIRSGWKDDDAYDAWFAAGLNNAKLAAVSTYRAYLPGFRKLLAALDGNLAKFYERLEQMQNCTRKQRRELLLAGITVFDC
ncbi:MAG: aminopeptidase, partial [Gammaproteobacteria bacterium]